MSPEVVYDDFPKAQLFVMRHLLQDASFREEVQRLRESFPDQEMLQRQVQINERASGIRGDSKPLRWEEVSQDPRTADYCGSVKRLAEEVGLPDSWGAEAIHRVVARQGFWATFTMPKTLVVVLSARVFDSDACEMEFGSVYEALNPELSGQFQPGELFWQGPCFVVFPYSTLGELREEARKMADRMWERLHPKLREMPGYRARRRGKDKLERDVGWLVERRAGKSYHEIAEDWSRKGDKHDEDPDMWAVDDTTVMKGVQRAATILGMEMETEV